MANKVLNVVLMCAGKSSRLGLNLPKVILPINGKSLIERTIKTLQYLFACFKEYRCPLCKRSKHPFVTPN